VPHDERSRLRNAVLAGHAGSGKTSLAEHLLHTTGAIARAGRVDDGTASLDWEAEEQKRKLSLSLAVATFSHAEHRITIIDTPGYADFVGEVIEGFTAVDSALITMDASESESGADTAISLGRSMGRPALFVITRCDRENADPMAAVDALRAEFGNKIAPLQVAIGKGESFQGTVDVVHGRAWLHENGSRREVPVPDDLAAEVALRRDQLLEAAAEADDDVLAKYLDGGEVTDAELEACLHKGVRDSVLAPVLLTSAVRDIGIEELLDAIVRYLPSPEEESPIAAHDGSGRDVSVDFDPDGPLLLQVFKTTADPFVGRLSCFRVWSGTIRSHDHVWNAERGEEERIGQVLRLHGKEHEAVGELHAGDIGAVAKLSHTLTGDSLSSRERPLTLPRIEFPQPTLSVAIEPSSKIDVDKLSTSLARLIEEDPTIKVERQAETGEDLLWAQGENQIAVATERLKRKFGTAVITRPPRVPYRETIRGHARVEGRHKKQTGGRGQFGHVWLELEPNPGGGVVFAEHIVGGVVPRQFFPGVEKGVRDVAEKGPIAGYPVIDFKATLVDGSFHTVDSDEVSFRVAGSMATRQGIHEAQPVLLEPIMEVEVRVPEVYMGDVNRDLATRRGRVLGMDSDDGLQTVRALVPQSELFIYATELRSLTGGRGTFRQTLATYEEVPPNEAHRVMEAHKKEQAASGH
jgi:elongation factor G